MGMNDDAMTKLKALGEKYAKATEWYDELMEDRYVPMHPQAKQIANQIGNEILAILKDAK